MELIPALDLINGTVVRLRQGRYDEVTTYGEPEALARSLVEAGAPRLHLVDLDAAKSGSPVNHGLIEAITKMVEVPVQCGGGVRTMADVTRLAEQGLDRIIVGTVALEDPDLARSMAERHPGKVLLGLDFRLDGDRLVPAGRGWITTGTATVDELLANFADFPFAGVLATAIARDGTLEGPDLISMTRLLEITDLPVVASGGVGELQDLRMLASLSHDESTLDGVVVGKAILEGRFAISEGVAACAFPG
ncbi:MAG: HisA/HisF-related TIM barrel protein [Actinomycetota bacterium]